MTLAELKTQCALETYGLQDTEVEVVFNRSGNSQELMGTRLVIEPGTKVAKFYIDIESPAVKKLLEEMSV